MTREIWYTIGCASTDAKKSSSHPLTHLIFIHFYKRMFKHLSTHRSLFINPHCPPPSLPAPPLCSTSSFLPTLLHRQADFHKLERLASTDRLEISNPALRLRWTYMVVYMDTIRLPWDDNDEATIRLLNWNQRLPIKRSQEPGWSIVKSKKFILY